MGAGPAAAAAALLVLAAPVAAQGGPAQATLRERAESARSRGAAAAPVLVYEIADFQCPYCARFAKEVFPRIDAEYVRTGKVKWVFVNFPLPAHPLGWAAAEAALCAGAVADRFWGFHDRLFSEQQTWSGAANPAAEFAGYARELGVPLAAYQSCIEEDGVALLILEDVIAAAASRVTGTPTFVIDNEEMLVGLHDFDDWKAMLDKALQRKAKKK